MPMDSWKRQTNGYVPGGRSIVTLSVVPGMVSMSMPWPVTVKVCAVSLTFVSVIV